LWDNRLVIRALLIASHFPPIGGGGVQRASKFARYLPEFGIEPLVFTVPGGVEGRWTPPDPSMLGDVAGVPTYRVPGVAPTDAEGFSSRIARITGSPGRFEEWWQESILRYGEEACRDIDVIIAECLPYETAFAVEKLARRTGLPWIADLQDPWALDEMWLYPTGIHRRLGRRAMRRTLRTAAGVVMNTPEAKRRLLDAFPEFEEQRVVSITNGFDWKDFAELRPRKRNSVFRIAHAGYLYTEIGTRHRATRQLRRALGGMPVPGVDFLTRSHVYLMQAIDKLMDEDGSLAGHLELHLAGVLSDADVAIAGDRPFVVFRGYLPHAETIDLLRSADLLFLPMQDLPGGVRAGLVPGKTYEYLASGTPVLAAVPEGDAHDIMIEAGNAAVCRPAAVADMAEAIRARVDAWREGQPEPVPRASVLARFERRELTSQLATLVREIVRPDVDRLPEDVPALDLPAPSQRPAQTIAAPIDKPRERPPEEVPALAAAAQPDGTPGFLSAELDMANLTPERPRFSTSEVHERTSAGVAYLASSSFMALFVSFMGNLLLARMLTPDDFGLVAIGTTLTTFGTAFAEGGLGSGMIRSPVAPTRHDLRALNGIQLAIALAICIPCALGALQFGIAGGVTAIMILSLPVDTLQTPGMVELTRSMRYDRISAVNLGALTASQVFAVVTVALGAGVWGFAVAAVVRSVVGVVLILVVGGHLYPPAIRGWRRLWPLMRFGIRFQSNWIVIVIGDQLLNVVVGAISGVGVLGLWSLAKKTLQVPAALFNSLASVAFPAISNLRTLGRDTSALVLRTVRLSTIVATLAFVPFAVASPSLIPALFGAKWQGAADVVPLCVLAAVLSGPSIAIIGGYLFAVGRVGLVVRSSFANAVSVLIVAAALLPSLGVRAVGVAAVVGAATQAVLFDRAARRVGGINPLRTAIEPVAAALIAGGLGLALSTENEHSLVLGLGAAAIAFGLNFGLLFAVIRSDLLEALRFTVGSFHHAASGLLPARSAPGVASMISGDRKSRSSSRVS
jgi:O-antigen/teichoic acid export membrane protein/glycosyltransferase involved in cell wall biosynthesis